MKSANFTSPNAFVNTFFHFLKTALPRPPETRRAKSRPAPPLSFDFSAD